MDPSVHADSRTRPLSMAPDFRVLLVEDNVGDIELVRDALDEVRLEVAHDGEQALALLREATTPPDLVLLDLKLPRLDGLGFLARVADHPRLKTIPMVVLTSSQAPRDVARAYDLGARACFAKPSTGLRKLLHDILSFVGQGLPRPEPNPRDQERPRELSAEVRRAWHLAAIVDSAADAIIGTAMDGTITTWNRAAEALYGYPAETALGRHIHLIVPETRRAELAAILDRVATGTEQHLRTIRVDRSGREIHVSLTLSPIRDSGGAIIGKSAIARDITEQAHAEERFRLAVEASPSAMLMIDAAGRIVLSNAEAERLFGYSRDELVGTRIDVLVPARFRDGHPDHRASFMRAPRARAMGAGRELYGVRKDGREVPVEIGLNPIETPSGTFVLSSIVDITGRRQAEEKFRLAVAASPSGIVMVDAGGTIVLVNAETERMFGYASGELTGKSVDALVPARFRGQHAHHRSSFADAPEARTMGTGRDLYGLRKDGTEFPVEVGLTPIETDEGRLVLSTIVDITERKLAEDALSSQARELARSNEELEQFAYVASHDLQEPLRMVSSYTELLAERYGDQLDEKGARYIEHAQDGAKRMRGLIDDLLAYSRVRTRGGELVPTLAEPSLRRAMQNLSIACRESNAIIDAYLDDVCVLADQTQLSQVFQNLLSNSIKFRRDEQPRITVRAHREGRSFVFSVRDDGIGIAPEHSERIFQMFERLHTRTAYAGTGIGLALCKRIIDRHGGRIWVESDGSTGSTFLFTLSASDTEPT